MNFARIYVGENFYYFLNYPPRLCRNVNFFLQQQVDS